MNVVGVNRVCVALDRGTAEENVALVETLSGRAMWFKVGMRQFYAEGASAVLAAIESARARLFLDLKLHDIPKTVGDAAAALARFRPSLLTVHASGGAEMIGAAVRALEDVGTGVLGVTVLTSLDGTDLIRAWGPGAVPVPDTVERLAIGARDAGAAGIVCSAHEASKLRHRLGPDVTLVTPGIRPVGADAGDQKRVMTPGRAVKAGSSLLVVGRPIHGADDPAAAFDAIVDEPVG